LVSLSADGTLIAIFISQRCLRAAIANGDLFNCAENSRQQQQQQQQQRKQGRQY